MAAFNRVDHDPHNLNAGSTFQILDSRGRLIELNTREADALTRWLTSFLHPEALLRPPSAEQQQDAAGTKAPLRLATLVQRLWHLVLRDFDADAPDIEREHHETLAALEARTTPTLIALLTLLSTCLDAYEDNPREWGRKE